MLYYISVIEKFLITVNSSRKRRWSTDLNCIIYLVLYQMQMEHQVGIYFSKRVFIINTKRKLVDPDLF